MPDGKKYQYYADAITALHVLWTCIIFAGVVVMFAWHPYAPVEIAVVSFTLLISLPFGAVCPLTLLEEKFRRKLDPSYTNGGSYLATYINKIFKTNMSVRGVGIAIGIFYALVYAVAIYFIVQRG